MNVSLEKINEHYFANANVYPQKSSKRKCLTMQTKPDIRYTANQICIKNRIAYLNLLSLSLSLPDELVCPLGSSST